MSLKLKLTSIGNSVGVVLPRKLLARLKADKGDILFVTEGPGGICLTPYDPEVEKQIAAGREVMREYRDALRALAK